MAAEIGSLQLPTCAGALSCMVWVVVTGRPTVLEAQAQVAEREPKPFARRLATTTGSGHISVHGGGQRDAARPKSCIFEANHYDFEQSQESRAEQSRGEERRGEERRGEESRGRRKRERERESAQKASYPCKCLGWTAAFTKAQWLPGLSSKKLLQKGLKLQT